MLRNSHFFGFIPRRFIMKKLTTINLISAILLMSSSSAFAAGTNKASIVEVYGKKIIFQQAIPKKYAGWNLIQTGGLLSMPLSNIKAAGVVSRVGSVTIANSPMASDGACFKLKKGMDVVSLRLFNSIVSPKGNQWARINADGCIVHGWTDDKGTKYGQSALAVSVIHNDARNKLTVLMPGTIETQNVKNREYQLTLTQLMGYGAEYAGVLGKVTAVGTGARFVFQGQGIRPDAIGTIQVGPYRLNLEHNPASVEARVNATVQGDTITLKKVAITNTGGNTGGNTNFSTGINFYSAGAFTPVAYSGGGVKLINTDTGDEIIGTVRAGSTETQAIVDFGSVPAGKYCPAVDYSAAYEGWWTADTGSTTTGSYFTVDGDAFTAYKLSDTSSTCIEVK
jgi:hypothetical protein